MNITRQAVAHMVKKGSIPIDRHSQVEKLSYGWVSGLEFYCHERHVSVIDAVMSLPRPLRDQIHAATDPALQAKSKEEQHVPAVPDPPDIEGTIEEIQQLCIANDIAFEVKVDGPRPADLHVSLKDEHQVEYWPLSKKRRAYVRGTHKGISVRDHGQVIELAKRSSPLLKPLLRVPGVSYPV